MSNQGASGSTQSEKPKGFLGRLKNFFHLPSSEVSTTNSAKVSNDISRPSSSGFNQSQTTLNDPVNSGTTIPVAQSSYQQHSARPTSKIKGAFGLAWDGLDTALRLLKESSDAFPPLKTAVGGIVALIDLVQTTKDNNGDYQRLANELAKMAILLAPHASKIKEDKPTKDTIKLIEAELDGILDQRDRGVIKRTIQANKDKGDIIKCLRRIENLFRLLQIDFSLQTLDTVQKLHEDTTLDKLSPIDDARFNSSFASTVHRQSCTPETRKAVLALLQEWADNPDAAKVFWMSGIAGTGKTTVTYSFCEWLEAEQLLGGNYFCSRLTAQSSEPQHILPTITFQLAQRFPDYRTRICDILKQDPGIAKLNINTQFRKLLLEPMEQLQDHFPRNIVVVIDALDECSKTLDIESFLQLLLTEYQHTPLKFFLTSRPEPGIRAKLESKVDSSSRIRLQEIEEHIVQADIQTYLKHELSRADASEKDILQIAQQADKLFIYAATLVRYIGGDSSRLRKIVGGAAGLKKHHTELDELYETIMSSACDRKKLEDDEVNAFRAILGTVVFAKEPLTVKGVASLVGKDIGETRGIVERLRSVLHLQDGDDGLIAPFHASFPDYLTTKDRSKDNHFDERCEEEKMATRCFDIMKAELKFNICNLVSSFVFDKDVPDLPERVKKNISSALSYGCRYWENHLAEAELTEGLWNQLNEFLTTRLLFWMEVLNLVGYMSRGESMLGNVVEWAQMTKYSSTEVQTRLKDYRNFTMEFAASACRLSTPHLYVSRLAFCRRTSAVYSHYYNNANGLINVKGSALEGWSSGEIWRWVEQAAVSSVAFSPDGRRVVSGSSDKTIRVWEVETGQTVAETGQTVAGPFAGHNHSVTSVAFSPDGRQVVSGSSDKTIRVWRNWDITNARQPLSFWLKQIPYPVSLSPLHAPSLSTSFSLHENGWAYFSNQPLFWVPSSFHVYLPHCSNSHVLGQYGSCSIDYTDPNILIGDQWAKCYHS
ncbi:hypothetical protein CPB83DRAFT_855213 [Crepidotus variabilis]|uniref:Nephrocystin 3-like N-terminal domain-containing protein n=1 Tax=Crepidotus variabilis TaxID=179855 RepID=A0A9P6JP23_9AGAR|nr:hypothetical protein CPB83DRAFT_855213 [Crepidotus variabilis]